MHIYKGSFIERTFFARTNVGGECKRDISSVADSILTDPFPLTLSKHNFTFWWSTVKWSYVMMKWRVSNNSDLSTHRISFVPREHIKSLQLQHFAVRQRRHHRNYGVWRVCEYDKHPLTSDSNPVQPLSVFCRYFSLFTKVFYSTYFHLAKWNKKGWNTFWNRIICNTLWSRIYFYTANNSIAKSATFHCFQWTFPVNIIGFSCQKYLQFLF